jgi:hypothetical protein
MAGLSASSSLARPHFARSFRIITEDLCGVNRARRTIWTTSRRSKPSNVGGLGLSAKDAVIGEQAAEPLTVEGIKARRIKSGKLVAGTAAYSDSDMFKSPVRKTPIILLLYDLRVLIYHTVCLQ